MLDATFSFLICLFSSWTIRCWPQRSINLEVDILSFNIFLPSSHFFRDIAWYVLEDFVRRLQVFHASKQASVKMFPTFCWLNAKSGWLRLLTSRKKWLEREKMRSSKRGGIYIIEIQLPAFLWIYEVTLPIRTSIGRWEWATYICDQHSHSFNLWHCWLF